MKETTHNKVKLSAVELIPPMNDTIHFSYIQWTEAVVADVFQIKCSWIFYDIHRKTSMLESLLDKAAGLKACKVIKKWLQHRFFPANVPNLLRKMFYASPPVAAYKYWKSSCRTSADRQILMDVPFSIFLLITSFDWRFTNAFEMFLKHYEALEGIMKDYFCSYYSGMDSRMHKMEGLILKLSVL